MIRRTISEWGRLAYGDGPNEIPQHAAQRLAAAARMSSLGGSDGSRIVTLGLREMKVGGIVGVLAAEGCVLEILPKIDGLADTSVRQQLVHMLNIASDLPVGINQTAKFETQSESLLEILIRIFAKRVLDAVRRGMPRTYLDEENDLPALRGKLDVKRQFTVLAATPQRLACRYSSLSPDIALNQIVKAAVTHLAPMAETQTTKQLLAELTFVYAEITPVRPKLLRWDLVRLDRTNDVWRGILSLAQLLLDGLFQMTTAGRQTGFGLLFEMNLLFEAYVANTLKRSAAQQGHKIRVQGGRIHCLRDLASDKPRFQTKPDVIICREGRNELIVDTKWKKLTAPEDANNLAVSQADIYQMMAYAHLYKASRVLLLYPHHEGLGGDERAFSHHRINGGDATVTIASIDISRRPSFADRLQDILFRQTHTEGAVATHSACVSP